MIAWFAAAALAATPALVPDRAVVAAPCVVDPADPCWDDAPALTRFAPEERVPGPAVSADVRLAWRGNQLLVKVGELPADTVVEVTLNRGVNTDDAVAYATGARYIAGGADCACRCSPRRQASCPRCGRGLRWGRAISPRPSRCCSGRRRRR
jgi:hypothetical protein